MQNPNAYSHVFIIHTLNLLCYFLIRQVGDPYGLVAGHLISLSSTVSSFPFHSPLSILSFPVSFFLSFPPTSKSAFSCPACLAFPLTLNLVASIQGLWPSCKVL